MPLYPPITLASAADIDLLWRPSQHGLLAANYDPAGTNNQVAATVGFVLLQKLWLPQSVTINNILAFVDTAGSALTSGQCFAAIIDSTGAVLKKSVTQHTAWQSTGVKTMALTAAQVAGGPGVFVWVALLANGTTAPQFACRSNVVSAGPTGLVNVGLTNATARVGYHPAGGAQTDITTVTPANITQNYPEIWAAVT